MFEELFENQLNELVGQNVEVATEDNIFEGLLIRVEDELVDLSRSSGNGYERERITTTVPISAISFVQTNVSA